MANDICAIYPNPASDKLNILLHSERSTKPLDIQIYDQTGRLILSKSYSDKDTLNLVYSIDISELKVGIYHIVIANGHKSTSKTFVKE